MLDQVRSSDWGASIFNKIVSVKRDDKLYIKKGQDAFITVNGLKKPIITKKGWSVQVKWKDGSVTWLPLITVESSKSIDPTEYAESNN